ncbi:acetylglutamate kinase [Planctomycetales bacterium ZRK34]|nr:acetylglutamate kinase [Planctomycetales bacterium ZRK34]
MQEAIHKADVLIEAHQYIRQFENAVVVVKVGGSIMDDPEALKGLLKDICFMDAVGMRPVIVHGGGKAINQAMAAEGLEAQFVQGRRYTDDRTLTIAEHVLVTEVNKFIVDQINAFEHKGMGLHSLASCAIFARRMFLRGENDRKIDIGFVGEVTDVNVGLIKALVEAEYIPVIAPIARDSAGGKLNVNADSAAGQVAAKLKAEKLVLVSDTHGIRTGESDDTLVSHLTQAQIQKLIDDGIISAGMLPKVDAALTALTGGVSKVHIVDGRIPHSLLLEIFSREGIGTEIVID